MPTRPRRLEAAFSQLELVAGIGCVLWALAQVHSALAVGTGGAALVAFNLRNRFRREG